MSIFSIFRKFSSLPRTMSASASEGKEDIDFTGGEIIEVAFENLDINKERLKNCRLPRPPTWDEIYDALIFTSEQYMPVGITGHFIKVDMPEGFGNCLFFATMTKAILDLLTNNTGGLGVGGVALGIRGRADGHYFLPKDINAPNLLTGGFHAWSGVDHEGTQYFIDFSYHWFHRAGRDGAECCGPKRFFIATEETMKKNRIFYHTNMELTNAIANAYSMESLADPLKYCMLYMRDVLIDPK